MKMYRYLILTLIFVSFSCLCCLYANQNIKKKIVTKDSLRVFVIDVNNGTWVNESLLIISPSGKTMLIDAGWNSGYPSEGAESNYGQNKVPAFLKSLNIKKLDWILLSHPHDDHIGGVQEIIDNLEIKVGKILYSEIPYEKLRKAEPSKYGGEFYIKLLEGIKKSCKRDGIPFVQTKVNDVIKLEENVDFKILATGQPADPLPNYINNNSIIGLLTYGDFSMLFTGDAGFEQEEKLIKKYPELSCVVLKAGHHAGAGSNSEKFLSFLKPKFSVASAPAWLIKDQRGVDCSKRFSNCTIPLMHTCTYGTIKLRSDGSNLEVITQKGIPLQTSYQLK